MPELLDYKCPNCGGALEFNISDQKMKCPYCDSEIDVAALKEMDTVLAGEPDKLEWETMPDSEWSDSETEGMNVYVCNSCGGEIVADENTAATACPYCGNPVVMKSKFSGDLRPDLVIPFKLNKDDAKKALLKHYEGKKLLPKIFKDKNHIDEIKGVYVPFWLFDSDVDATVSYDATNIRTWRSGDYNYTETSHFSVYREGVIGFDNIPVDGSSKFADELMESIEPFDMKEAVDFQTAYLAGYLADKYDVDAQTSVERANSRIKNSVESYFQTTVSSAYESVTPSNSSVKTSSGRSKYALLPVWLLNTTYNGNRYTFAMNGQTGKLVGDLPIDKGLLKKYIALSAAGIFAAAVGLLGFFFGPYAF